MRAIGFMVVFMLLISIIAGGCTSTTDYKYTGGEPQPTGTSKATSSAKYSSGDIIQSDTSYEAYNADIAAIITGVENETYLVHMLYRVSPDDVWKKASGYSGSGLFSKVESVFPNKIGHTNPDSLATITVPTPTDTTPTPTKTVATPTPAKVVTTPTAVSGRDRLQILSHNLEYGGYGEINAVGVAKNIGTSRISFGSVEVKFYDRDGNVIGNSLDIVQDLDPGETWKFKAMYFDMDGAVHTYKIGIGTVM